MFLSDSNSLANIKNRTEKSLLNAKLSSIEREKQNEIRMLNNEKRRFQSQFSKKKLNYEFLYMDKTPSIIDKRTSERSNISSNLSSTEEDFQRIHSLLFTNGEVDIEKVLCLHLLSAHKTESLTPPQKKFKCSNRLIKDYLPIERLIGRSKKMIKYENRDIPWYILEVFMPQTLCDQCFKCDKRLEFRVLINHKIFELIKTVLGALQQSNQEKLQHFLQKANDQNFIRQMLLKKNIGQYFTSLQNHPLVTSCESFSLSPPYKPETIELKVRTTTGTLEHMLLDIRRNVLQPPTPSWEKLVNSLDLPNAKSISAKKMEHHDNPGNSKRDSKDSNTLNPHNKRNSSGSGSKRSSATPEETFGRHVSKDFIAKNIEACTNYKKIEYADSDDPDYHSRRTSTDSNKSRRSSNSSNSPVVKLNVLKSPTIKESDKEDLMISDKDFVDDEMNFLLKGKTHGKRRNSTGSDGNKFHLKQTTCPACMEKWKTPLPVPKTPRVKQSSIAHLNSNDTFEFTTNKENRVSLLINKEMHKLDSYDRRFSNDSGASNIRKTNNKKTESITIDEEDLNLKSIDLAKIEQEIKQKETQKKLENFLRSSI